MTELLVVVGLAGVGVAAAFAAYLGSLRSWEGTARLADLQREASVAMSVMTREVREATDVDIGVGGDSLNIYYYTGSFDSLTASFRLDGQGQIVDISGGTLTDNVDSLWVSSPDGRTVHIDLYMSSDMGTAQVTSDDQSVLVSSSVVCRN